MTAFAIDLRTPRRSRAPWLNGPLFRLARWFDDYGAYHYRPYRRVAWWMAKHLWCAWKWALTEVS